MTYWTLQYVDANNVTQEVSFAQLAALEGGQVVSDGWVAKFISHKASTITLRLPGVTPDRAPAIPFESRVTIWSGRTSSSGNAPFSGGTRQFAGYRTDRSGLADPHRPSSTYTFEDEWYFLEHSPFCQTWTRATNNATPPATTTYLYQSVILFMGNPGQNYLPAPISGLRMITSGQQITDILNWAISIGANLQVGQIDPSLYSAVYPVQNVNCANAIRICLRPHPDCFTEIDYTTTPPTFNIRKRVNLTPVTLPYAYTDANGRRHTSSEVQPRPELIPRRIALFYRVISGGYLINTPQDIYPAGVTTGLRSLEYSIDLQGPKATLCTASITSNPFDPTQSAWWIKKIPSLGDASITNLVITNPTVVDANGNAVNIANFPYELDPKSSVLTWEGISIVAATVTAQFSYTKNLSANNAIKSKVVTAQRHDVHVKLVNAPTGNFQFTQYLTTGESVPPGLAQSIYTALATLQYSFTHSCVEAPFNGWIKPGKHAINLAGGPAAWTTMNATPQEVTYTMHLDGAGNSFDNFTVKCGPVEHLEPGQLVQLYNLFANRDLTKIDTNERLTGLPSPGQTVAMPNDTAQENSIPAETDDAYKVFTSGGNYVGMDPAQGMIAII